ncbi:uncharacterized protein BXZ73DRAFT_81682 [Epithele typhae]|uniref:uncharacterized protein n=1 Tax=Epithele typhae TaxID=378194 RepID=UPI0020073FFE|nr:uncharacterized protein BXZ73DRAFT_81682 [Epithele typhae]KAH9914384.1 hypothetical protein BXZ73DRAFT_81682 [Epithele typhae]
MPRIEHEYHPLLPDTDDSRKEDSTSTLDLDERQKSVHTSARPASPVLRWAVVAVLLVALTDLIGIAYIAHAFRSVFQPTDYTSKLEFADPYVGLKELYSSGRIKSTPIDPILVRPRMSAQVFVDEPDRLAPRGERDYWSEQYGRLSPHERRLYVTPTVRPVPDELVLSLMLKRAEKTHTIVQLRAIDFGMEECELVITLPAPSEALERGAFFNMTAASRLDVFRLRMDGSRGVDVKKLSYRSKPPVVEQVAVALEVTPGGNTAVHRFACPTASLHVFEFACAKGTECMLDTWSSQNTTFGVNMYQHQTI